MTRSIVDGRYRPETQGKIPAKGQYREPIFDRPRSSTSQIGLPKASDRVTFLRFAGGWSFLRISNRRATTCHRRRRCRQLTGDEFLMSPGPRVGKCHQQTN